MRLMSSPRFSGLTQGIRNVQGSKTELDLLKRLEELLRDSEDSDHDSGPGISRFMQDAKRELVAKLNERNSETIKPFLAALEKSPYTPGEGDEVDLAIQAAIKRVPPSPKVYQQDVPGEDPNNK